MKIVNIDATETICEKVWGFQYFILEVVSLLNREIVNNNDDQLISQNHGLSSTSLPLSPIRKFEKNGYENIAYLLHTIPIYLRRSRPERWNEEEDIVDLLGAYYPNRKNDNPYIEMYVDNIYSSANGNEEHFKWLFTKVLIHELAHAALDIFNNEHCSQTTEKVLHCTPFGKWREESMANAVALKIIKKFGKKRFYNYAKNYMLSQSAEYALGVLMEDFGPSEIKSVMDGKKNGVCQELQKEWLNYVQGKPTWTGLKRWNEILSTKEIFKYKKMYYTVHQDLVLDILLDYIKQNKPISFNQLCSVFPNVKVWSKEAYRPLSVAVDDSQFYTESNQILHLTDGDYVLFKYWYNNDLNNFLSLAGKNGFVVDTLLNY